MTTAKEELTQRLKRVLAELNKLSDQIRATHDFSESSELILCLEEIVKEQTAVKSFENSSHSTHATR